MANIHFILNGKGGVGKTFAALMLAQYLASAGRKPLCIDTDPVNATFAGFKGLGVTRLEIATGSGSDVAVDTTQFDQMITSIAELTPETSDVVIDNGAASFVAVASYMTECRIPELLQSVGHSTVIHAVCAGGPDSTQTVSGTISLLKSFGGACGFVIWLNEHAKPVVVEGKPFDELKFVKDRAKDISGIVRVPHRSKMFADNLIAMLEARRTFEEQIAQVDIVTRMRLGRIRDEMFAELAAVPLLAKKTAEAA